jgi:dTDP-4-amino-4,6-dideoxygalactose transaminase
VSPQQRLAVGLERFAIGFDHRDRERLFSLWTQALDSERWSDGELLSGFEAAWGRWNGLPAVAFSSWTGAALAALSFADVRGQAVLCPSNTFMAAPLAIEAAGGRVEFVDCNREDLCASFADLQVKAERHRPRAAFLTHIGGHLAFDVAEIAAYCRDERIFLIEDCAHAHGASWHGRRAGTWGDAGVWSFAPTKTISTGEGGALVSRDERLLAHARAFRDYGKPDHRVRGLNFRMSEFTAAIGIVQTERLDEIVRWKNRAARTVLHHRYPARLELPDGMTSGYYKYVVFQPVAPSTGKVYDTPCHRILGHEVRLPNSDWVAAHHWCVPLYYHGDALAG